MTGFSLISAFAVAFALCFWQNGFDHLLPEAKPFYELLRKAGIIADTPEQAATLTALHWNDVSKWWNSPSVQSARAAFCAEYARTEKKPVRTLRRLLLSRSVPHHDLSESSRHD